MLVEIAANRPLPPYTLSSEALKRREDRIAADQLRENKNKKKAAPVVPVRKGAPPSANSVAAKRLAAKRGGQNNFLSPSQSESQPTDFSFEANFESFQEENYYSTNDSILTQANNSFEQTNSDPQLSTINVSIPRPPSGDLLDQTYSTPCDTFDMFSVDSTQMKKFDTFDGNNKFYIKFYGKVFILVFLYLDSLQNQQNNFFDEFEGKPISSYIHLFI